MPVIEEEVGKPFLRSGRERKREGKKRERFRISRAVTRTIARDRETIPSPGRNPFCGFSPFPLDNGPRAKGEIEFATSVNFAVASSPLPQSERSEKREERKDRGDGKGGKE